MIELAPRYTVMPCDDIDEALLYCRFLDVNGHNDWRMPTYDEYISSELPMAAWYVGRRENDDLGTHLKFVRSHWVLAGRFVRAVRDITE